MAHIAHFSRTTQFYAKLCRSPCVNSLLHELRLTAVSEKLEKWKTFRACTTFDEMIAITSFGSVSLGFSQGSARLNCAAQSRTVSPAGKKLAISTTTHTVQCLNFPREGSWNPLEVGLTRICEARSARLGYPKPVVLITRSKVAQVRKVFDFLKLFGNICNDAIEWHKLLSPN